MSKKHRREANGESHFRVEAILDKRLVNGNYEYLVNFRGIVTSYQSWEAASSFKGCSNVLSEFERDWAAKQRHTEQSACSQNDRKRKRSFVPVTPQKGDRISDIISRIVAIDSARTSLAKASPAKRGRCSLETTASSPDSTSSCDRLLSSTSDHSEELEEMDQACFFDAVSSRPTSTPLPPAHDDDASNDTPAVRYLIEAGERVQDVLGLCPKSRFPAAIVRYDSKKTEVVPTALLARYQPEVLLRYYQRLEYL
ncbi:hypothetical protein AAVH_04164 [Aphelenchoides avenae]|nr:hypothetical protein AAVH_04164 [Aphelenchus avenae]